MNITEYVCPSILLLIAGFVIYQFVTARVKSKKNKRIIADYKGILDNKLTPIGFERHQDYEDSREKVTSFKRNNLEVTLYFGPPSFIAEIYATSGKKTTLEERIKQMSPNNKVKFGNEQNKHQLVDALDFRVVASENEDVKAQSLETLDKWLVENS